MTAHQTAYFESLDHAATAIERREPLMFDGESAHGQAALLAVAALELEFAGDARRHRTLVPDQITQVDYLIEALQQYRLQLTTPDCPQCGAALTAGVHDRLGRACFCPTCDMPRGGVQ